MGREVLVRAPLFFFYCNMLMYSIEKPLLLYFSDTVFRTDMHTFHTAYACLTVFDFHMSMSEEVYFA